PSSSSRSTPLIHFVCLTFDMSGIFQRASPARRRPLDGRVRRLCPALARQTRIFLQHRPSVPRPPRTRSARTMQTLLDKRAPLQRTFDRARHHWRRWPPTEERETLADGTDTPTRAPSAHFPATRRPRATCPPRPRHHARRRRGQLETCALRTAGCPGGEWRGRTPVVAAWNSATDFCEFG